jgi:hypothetical protein
VTYVNADEALYFDWSCHRRFLLFAQSPFHHIRYNDFEILRKSEPTLEYTFFSLKQANPMEILQIDALLDAGIEDVMLDRGLVTEQRLDQIFEQIERLKARQKK